LMKKVFLEATRYPLYQKTTRVKAEHEIC